MKKTFSDEELYRMSEARMLRLWRQGQMDDVDRLRWRILRENVGIDTRGA